MTEGPSKGGTNVAPAGPRPPGNPAGQNPVAPDGYGVAGMAIDFARLKLKCGTLEIDVNEWGHGTVTLDGKPTVCRRIQIDINPAGQKAVAVVMDLAPAHLRYKETKPVSEDYQVVCPPAPPA